MIKNEKRTAKQEKKFIKQLEMLGFDQFFGRIEMDLSDLIFGYFPSISGGRLEGDFFICGDSKRYSQDLAHFPTIPQVLALIKEHTGEDLSHKLKKSKYEKLEERVKMLEARCDYHNELIESLRSWAHEKGSELSEMQNDPEAKEETYDFGDVVELQNGNKYGFILDDGSESANILLYCYAKCNTFWVNRSQIKKV